MSPIDRRVLQHGPSHSARPSAPCAAVLVCVCQVEHVSLCASGLCLLWLLCSVASGLYVGRVSAPSLYCRDLNRWLRLFGLEWRPLGSAAEGELRCLSGAAMQRRARREKDKLAAAEREREQVQATVEAEAERNRLHFLELLEREELESDGGNSSSGSSAGMSRASSITLLPKATGADQRLVQHRSILTDSDSPKQYAAEKVQR